MLSLVLFLYFCCAVFTVWHVINDETAAPLTGKDWLVYLIGSPIYVYGCIRWWIGRMF